MLGQDLAERTVLDAFGGSGLLGFEAWSRGARVTIVDRDARALASIRSNAESLRADIVSVRADIRTWVSDDGPYELVLADPPYDEPPGQVLEALERHVGRQLVLEMSADRSTPAMPGLSLDRRRDYGGTALCVFVRDSP